EPCEEPKKGRQSAARQVRGSEFRPARVREPETELCHQQKVQGNGKEHSKCYPLHSPELSDDRAQENGASVDGLPPGAGVNRTRCTRDGVTQLVACPEQHPEREYAERNNDFDPRRSEQNKDDFG